MKKKDLIQQILIIDNVGETDNINLKKMTKKDLEILYDRIFEYAHSRQKSWMKFGPPPKK
jgi:hypothetical protein